MGLRRSLTDQPAEQIVGLSGSPARCRREEGEKAWVAVLLSGLAIAANYGQAYPMTDRPMRLSYHLARAYALLNEQADRDHERHHADGLQRSLVPQPRAAAAQRTHSTDPKSALHAARLIPGAKSRRAVPSAKRRVGVASVPSSPARQMRQP